MGPQPAGEATVSWLEALGPEGRVVGLTVWRRWEEEAQLRNLAHDQGKGRDATLAEYYRRPGGKTMEVRLGWEQDGGALEGRGCGRGGLSSEGLP